MNSIAKRRADPILIEVFCVAALMSGKGNVQRDGPTDSAASEPSSDIRRSSIRNLQNLHIEIKGGYYALNGVPLLRVSAGSISFSTANHAYKVRVTLLKTVLISHGEPIDQADRELLGHWSQDIPKVSAILRQQDALGALKVIAFDLIGNRNRQDMQLQEQLMLLWSADPAEAKSAGRTGFGPLMRFTEPLVDVQYRTPNLGSNRFFRKVFLQIFYLHHGDYPMTLGAFVIASESSGEYEFYLVPRSLLDQIIIKEK